MAAVMEYCCAELLDIAGAVCKSQGKRRVYPHHLEIAIRNDIEFERLFYKKTIRGGGRG